MTAPGTRPAAEASSAEALSAEALSAEALAAAVERVRARVAHWTPARWAAAPALGPPDAGVPGVGRPVAGAAGTEATRAGLMHVLVQRIADLAARAEGEPRRNVPRLDNDLALCDQLLVVVADLRAARPPAEFLDEATELVRQAHRAL